jgi:hypothetical protein
MHRFVIAVLAALIAWPSPMLAQRDRDEERGRQRDDNAFEWSGRIPQGNWISVHNLNGSISVEAASGDEVEVRASKTWRRGDPSVVRFETVRDGDNIVICALWTERSTCDEDGLHTRGRDDDDRENNRNNDVAAHFTIRLPRGVKVRANSVNGSIEVAGAREQVVARTVNGRIDVATSTGPVDAQTVNGGINVRIESLSSSSPMEFETVNGSVRVEAPSNLAAEVEMHTVNGALETEFPLTIEGRGRLSRHRIMGTINGGGPRLTMKTVNGSVHLLRRG